MQRGMDSIKEFVRMSKYAGERFDLVQAGGGNSSVKSDGGKMYIKASGFSLSEVEHDRGFSILDNNVVLAMLDYLETNEIKGKRDRERFAKEEVESALLSPSARPSIETALHALLPKYVLHTHPIAVNAVVCSENWEKILKSLFPKCVLVSYATPGVDLSLLLRSAIRENAFFQDAEAKAIFLQNHGLIVAAEKCQDVIDANEHILEVLENYLDCDLSRYKSTSKISKFFNDITGETQVAYCVSDSEIYESYQEDPEIFESKVFCPDAFIYCGLYPLRIENFNDRTPVDLYYDEIHEFPKACMYEDEIFIIANNIRKAKESEDVLKAHCKILSLRRSPIRDLPKEELLYLGKWEAEKFRRNI